MLFRSRPVLEFCGSLTQVMFKFAGVIMKFAPLGVGAAIAVTVGHQGLGSLITLGKLVLTLYAALVVFVVCVLGVVIFTGLTAYDTQRIKADYLEYAYAEGTDEAGKRSVLDALPADGEAVVGVVGHDDLDERSEIADSPVRVRLFFGEQELGPDGADLRSRFHFDSDRQHPGFFVAEHADEPGRFGLERLLELFAGRTLFP